MSTSACGDDGNALACLPSAFLHDCGRFSHAAGSGPPPTESKEGRMRAQGHPPTSKHRRAIARNRPTLTIGSFGRICLISGAMTEPSIRPRWYSSTIASTGCNMNSCKLGRSEDLISLFLQVTQRRRVPVYAEECRCGPYGKVHRQHSLQSDQDCSQFEGRASLAG